MGTVVPPSRSDPDGKTGLIRQGSTAADAAKMPNHDLPAMGRRVECDDRAGQAEPAGLRRPDGGARYAGGGAIP